MSNSIIYWIPKYKYKEKNIKKNICYNKIELIIFRCNETHNTIIQMLCNLHILQYHLMKLQNKFIKKEEYVDKS